MLVFFWEIGIFRVLIVGFYGVCVRRVVLVWSVLGLSVLFVRWGISFYGFFFGFIFWDING